MSKIILSLITCLTISLTARGQESSAPEFSNLNVETALVAFYSVFFMNDLGEANPISFFNSENPKKRYKIYDFLEASTGTALEGAIQNSLDTLVSQETSRGAVLVHFAVPGGKIFYSCHSHKNLRGAADNHCLACVKDGSIKKIRLSEENYYLINYNCPQF